MVENKKETDKVKGKKFLKEDEYKKLPSADKKNYVKEWSCKCNNCGKKWAYLDKIEKQMKSQAISNSLMGLGMCCNPCGAIFSNKSIDTSNEIEKLKQCPKCQSSNAKCEARYFKKT